MLPSQSLIKVRDDLGEAYLKITPLSYLYHIWSLLNLNIECCHTLYLPEETLVLRPQSLK